MNGINSIRLDVNSARHDLANSRKKITRVVESGSSTEADKQRRSRTDKIEYQYNSERTPVNIYSDLVLSDSQFYRTNLLGEIYSKMSGSEPRFKPGSFVEYFA